jgi:hypothetical protein
MGIRRVIGKVLNAGLKRFGLRLVYRSGGLDWDYSLERFKLLGFAPKTVIDIGVAQGTPVLYRNFPDAYYILVDPLREAVPYMESLSAGFSRGGRVS